MALEDHDRWEVLTDTDEAIAATSPDGIVHATRLEGTVKPLANWRLNIHSGGRPVVHDEVVDVPIDADIWDLVTERLDQLEQEAQV